MLREFFPTIRRSYRGFYSFWPTVRFAVFHKSATEQAFRDRSDIFHFLEMFMRMLKRITKDGKHSFEEPGRECFLFQVYHGMLMCCVIYLLAFCSHLHKKLHYEQQPRQNVFRLCPQWAHKRTLNWVIQWQVCKDVTGVLEQGDALALQKSALWVNNVSHYQFGHAAKVNVKIHWSTHSSAFAAAYQAPARRQVSFLLGNNHRNRAADADDPGRICRYVR